MGFLRVVHVAGGHYLTVNAIETFYRKPQGWSVLILVGATNLHRVQMHMKRRK